VEPAITFAPGGVAILNTQTAYNLRFAFLPALNAHFLRVRITIVFETTLRIQTRDGSRITSKNYSESGLRCLDSHSGLPLLTPDAATPLACIDHSAT
jgi:hypothetical protein